MEEEDRQLIERVSRLLKAWDAAFEARDQAALDHLSEDIEGILRTPRFLEALRRSREPRSG